jgi:hypothetical protein
VRTSRSRKSPEWSFPQKHVNAFPQKHVNAFPQKHVNAFPQKHVNAFPQKHVTPHPRGRPGDNTGKHPLLDLSSETGKNPMTLTRSTTITRLAPQSEIRDALTDLRIAVLAATVNAGRFRRAEIRAAVTRAISIERAILNGTADLAELDNTQLSTLLSDTVRLRALGRVMDRLIGPAPSGAVSGWWIPKMSAVIGDRPGLHMDARDALTARFER